MAGAALAHAANEANTAVSQRDQVLQRQACAAVAVGADGVEVGVIFARTNKHRRNLERLQLFVVHGNGIDEYTVETVTAGHTQELSFTPPFPIAVGENDGNTFTIHYVLHAAGHVGPERIGDVRNGQHDGV